MKSFFGEIDRNKDGKVASEYPAWTFPRQIENAKEEIDKKQRALDGGFVDRESEGEYKMAIERETERLTAIENSRPSLDKSEIDLCSKVYKSLVAGIGKTMPTRNDMHHNLIDAHDENRLNTSPSISVSADAAKMAQENEIRISDSGNMSRNDASRLAKILGHILGENTNMERLRRMGSSRK